MEGQREEEGGAMPDGGAHGDGSPHEGHEGVADGQAKASAAVLAARALIRLGREEEGGGGNRDKERAALLRRVFSST